jgi:16S rRNA (guanine527-N7)-methyltransferase
MALSVDDFIFYKNHSGTQVYVSELLKWNKGMNLIGKSTEADVWENHIRDSLELLSLVKEDSCDTVIDIGSGGGLPSVPLALLIPDKRFIVTEVDSKKLAFLEFITAKLKLNATVADLNRDFVFKKDAAVTSRAFSTIKNIVEWGQIHIEGRRRYYLLKGQRELTEQELTEAGIKEYQLTELTKGCVVMFNG